MMFSWDVTINIMFKYICLMSLCRSNLSSLITSTKWASLLSLKFLERRGMSAEWSMPMAPPLHVFFSFSCSISHSDVWLFFKASSWGLSRPFRAFGLGPAETAGEHFRFEESWGQEIVKQRPEFPPKSCINGYLLGKQVSNNETI